MTRGHARPAPAPTSVADLHALLADVNVDFFVLRDAFRDYLRTQGLGDGPAPHPHFDASRALRPLVHPGLPVAARQALGLQPRGATPTLPMTSPQAQPLPPATAAAWRVAFAAATAPADEDAEARRRARLPGGDLEALVRLQRWCFADDHAPHAADWPVRRRHLEALLDVACGMTDLRALTGEGATIRSAAAELAERDALRPRALAVAGLAGRLADAGPDCRRLSVTALTLWDLATAALHPGALHDVQAEALRAAAASLDATWARFGAILPPPLRPRPLDLPPTSAETWSLRLEDLRNVNTFLRGLTGLRPRMANDFRVVAATGALADIDPAIRSRFHDLVALTLPDIAGYHRLFARAFGPSYASTSLEAHLLAWAACGLDLHGVAALIRAAAGRLDVTALRENAVDLHVQAGHRAGTVRALEVDPDGKTCRAELTWADVLRRIARRGHAAGMLQALVHAHDRTWRVKLNAQPVGMFGTGSGAGICVALLRGPPALCEACNLQRVDN